MRRTWAPRSGRGRREPPARCTFTFQLARTIVPAGGRALGVQAIDGVHVEFRDARASQRELGEARRDGFTGKLAIHPDQVAAINAAFTPTEAEFAHARRIVAAFAPPGVREWRVSTGR